MQPHSPLLRQNVKHVKMIIVATYPDSVSYNISPSLPRLHQALRKLLPIKNAYIHMLPIFKSCGDGGFAITDFTKVDETFGTWSDLERIGNDWPIIIDGVFNHVGVDSNLVKKYIDAPQEHAGLFFVSSGRHPESPRGGTASRYLHTSEGVVSVRATHSSSAVDINLENPLAVEYVESYLTEMSFHKIKGIRLDAVAYYKKGREIRHNVGSSQLANVIAKMVINKDMKPFAQLDADNTGLTYFPSEANMPIFDFSYPSILLLSLWQQSSSPLRHFLSNHQANGRCVIRPLRTHDGILLRSGNLSSSHLDDIINMMESCGINIRYINRQPYEVNSSLPYILNKFDSSHFWNILRMSIVLTGIVSQFPYYYLPAIVGSIPEQFANKFSRTRFSADDPRTINRLPILNWETQSNLTFVAKQLPQLLKQLSYIHTVLDKDLSNGITILDSSESSMTIQVADEKLMAEFNFSNKYKRRLHSLENTQSRGYIPIISSDYSNDYTDPYGYTISLKHDTLSSGGLQ